MAARSDAGSQGVATPAQHAVIGIDASNISGGGGATHLVELLAAADPTRHGFARLVVWASGRTLARLAPRPWLDLRTEPVLEHGFLRRAAWQRGQLGQRARSTGCDLLFVPGGSFSTPFRPVVTMSRNMLPFEPTESLRFGRTPARLKMLALRLAQSSSMRRADGTIFLTRYARDTVTAWTGPLPGATEIIPHGLDARFSCVPRAQRALEDCTFEHPFRWLYVSTIDVYKHQWQVAESVAGLRRQGLPLAVDFIGSAQGGMPRLASAMRRFDPDGEYIRYLGELPHEQLHARYREADGFIYASSCENLPNILLEAMAAGLPIACSARGPMPEVLGKAGRYFDPEDVGSIASCIEGLLRDPEARHRLAHAAHEAAGAYSWLTTADRTFDFFHRVLREVAARGKRTEAA